MFVGPKFERLKSGAEILSRHSKVGESRLLRLLDSAAASQKVDEQRSILRMSSNEARLTKLACELEQGLWQGDPKSFEIEG